MKSDIIDYEYVYKNWNGRLLFGTRDCETYCIGSYHCCKCPTRIPLLPFEANYLRSKGIHVKNDDQLVCRGKPNRKVNKIFWFLARQSINPYWVGMLRTAVKLNNRVASRCYGENRPVLCRSFPLFPKLHGKDSHKLAAYKGCSEIKYMTTSFINEAEKFWNYLLSYRSIRDSVPRILDARLENEELVEVNNIIREYDHQYYLHYGRYRPKIIEILKRAQLPLGSSVLFVGCGMGVEVHQLNQMGYEATGIDVNPFLLARKVTKKAKYGDARNVSKYFSQKSVDYLICIDLLEHFSEEEVIRTLSQFREITRKACIIAVTTRDMPGYTIDPTHCLKLSWNEWTEIFRQFGSLETWKEGYGVMIHLT